MWTSFNLEMFLNITTNAYLVDATNVLLVLGIPMSLHPFKVVSLIWILHAHDKYV